MSQNRIFLVPGGERRIALGAVLLTLGVVCSVYFGYQMGGGLLKMASERVMPDFPVAWVLGFSQLAFLMFPAVLMLMSERRRFSDVLAPQVTVADGQTKASLPTSQHYLLGAICVVAIQFFSASFTPVQYDFFPPDWAEALRSFSELSQDYFFEIFGELNAANFLRSLLIVAVIPALAEETLFRGYLQPKLARRWSPATAIFVTALLFATLHFNPDALIPLFLVGVLLGLAAWHTGGILLPIVLHFVNNAMAVAVYFAMPDLTDTSAHEGSWGVSLLALVSLGFLLAAFVRLTPGAGRETVAEGEIHSEL